jgi:hypothetical protein
MDEVKTDQLDLSQPVDLNQPARRELALSTRRLADAMALLYIGVIASVASLTGAFYVMFPELGALSWDVMEHPRGRWASSPLMLALTPALTGILGTMVTRTLPYGFVSVLITVAGGVALIQALRSPVAPALSAGLLPLTLGVTSWWYPPGVLSTCVLLAAISIPWRRYSEAHDPGGDEPADSISAPAPEPPASSAGISRVLPAALWPLLAFVAFAVIVVKLTGLRFILFPPLVVILYEMLSHPNHCPWIGRPIGLPIACFLAAAGGYFLHAHITLAAFAAMLSMVWGIAVLRALDLNVPPVLAVALLPMVMVHSTVAYPFAVGIGTAMAAAWFAAFKILLYRSAEPAAAKPPSISTFDSTS